jgi:hypothetical protein
LAEARKMTSDEVFSQIIGPVHQQPAEQCGFFPLDHVLVL